MKVTLLGTGTSQGVPVIGCQCPVCQSSDFRDKRLRASILIEINGKTIVVDSGPDFRQQLLRENITNIDAIFYTHEHKDHTAGLDDIRPINFKYNKDIPLYAEERVIEALKKEFSYIFSNHQYPGLPKITINAINSQPFYFDNIEIIPIRAYHYKLPVLGYRIGNFAYITDTNNIPEEEMLKLKGLDVLVLNALQKETHISHFTLDEAITVAKSLNPNTTYFTHISHKMGKHAIVENELQDNFYFAYDGLTIEL